MQFRFHIILISAALAGTAMSPAAAQTRPTPMPMPVPEKPTTLPAPVPPNYQRPTPLPQPIPPQQSARYFAGTVKCESQNFRPRTCRANRNQGRVEIVQVHGGSCVRNSSFRYDNNSITVTDGCRATFAYGYGNVRPKAESGSSALPWLLAGAGATAGIVAIANSGNNNQPPPPEARPAPPPEAAPPPPPPPPPVEQGPFPALPPAKITANIQMLTPDQQRSMQTCLFEGARQAGITGASAVRLDNVDFIEQGSGGWRFRFRATGTWPNGDRQFSVFCRATPTSIVEFTVTPTGQ